MLEKVILTYVLKNVNISNDSNDFSRSDVKSFSSRYVLDGSIQNIKETPIASLLHHYLKKCQKEVVLRSGNHFYHGRLLQYFEGCPRASSFHLNNLNNEVHNKM